jgi:hypothetical protein
MATLGMPPLIRQKVLSVHDNPLSEEVYMRWYVSTAASRLPLLLEATALQPAVPAGQFLENARIVHVAPPSAEV